MSRTAFVTFAYPGCEQFLAQTLDSLTRQTDQEFDVIIFNNSLDSLDTICQTSLNKTPEICAVYGNVPAIRSYGLKQMKTSGYHNVIFGDADDVFAENRIEVIKQLLSENDVVVNDLDVCNENLIQTRQAYFQNRLPSECLLNKDTIRLCNCIGFTNSALRADVIPETEFPDTLTAIDWALFTTILLANARALFTGATSTKYRIHNRSHYDITSTNPSSLSFQVKVKYRHYEYLAQRFREYEREYNEFGSLQQKLKDTRYFDRYKRAMMAQLTEFPFWWEAAKLETEETH